MGNRLDACENRWLRRIMRITYKDSITNEKNDRTEDTVTQNLANFSEVAK